MNFPISAITLGIVLLTLSTNKGWCNGVNEVLYSYRYAIEALGVISQHWEERIGDTVRGQYSLLQPDGLVRVVQYKADSKRGLNASVTYRRPPGSLLLGHLRFPDYYKHPIIFAKPVSLITSDLFIAKKSYPNLLI